MDSSQSWTTTYQREGLSIQLVPISKRPPQLPPLNSKREPEKRRVTQSSPNPNTNPQSNSKLNSNQIVVEKISHIKQHSIDSGVGSQHGSSNTLRPFTPSKTNQTFKQHYRSISENALQSPGFSVHEKVPYLKSELEVMIY